MKWAPVGYEARIAPPTLAPFVTLSVVGESLTTSVARDYNLWVYIITNEHDSVLYVGMTNDLVRRITEHRTGEISGFAADYRCKKLVFYEHCTNVLDAIAREKQIKNWSRAKKVKLIATLNPRWIDLALDILGE
jgi:putative endonuclease